MNESKSVKKIKQDVAGFMQRLYNKGLTTSLGGNISCRVNKDTFAITSSQSDKACITGDLIGLVKADGTSLNPEVKLSIETFMHLAIYKKRPEINAIVHAHPTMSSFFTVTDRKINCRLSSEGRALLGEPAYAPYALMGTKELAEIVSEYALKSNVVFMKNHGVITMADSLIVAFDRMEVTELTARLTILTEINGGARELTKEQIEAIDKLMNA